MREKRMAVLCLPPRASAALWEWSSDTAAARTAPGTAGTEREKASPGAVFSSNQKLLRCHYGPPYGYAWGEGKGKESAALMDMLVLGSKEHDAGKKKMGRDEKMV